MCTCVTGFTGRRCEVNIVTSPSCDALCLNGATCQIQRSNGGSDFIISCACLPQFSGSLCEQRIPPSCATNSCLNGGTCLDTSGTGRTCVCLPGFIGTNCSVTKGMNPNLLSIACHVVINSLSLLIFLTNG